MLGEEMTEKEMDWIIRDLHENIGCADDEGFPSFLFDIVYGVDESDPYYNMVKIDTPKEVLNLKRKYVDFHEWLDALETYDAYLETLAEKYGSVEIVKETYNAGEAEEYVPAEPKLKPTKINKQYLRAGIIPPRNVPKPPKKINYHELAEKMFPIKGEIEDLNELPELYKEPPKRIKKQFDQTIKRLAGEYRQENIHNARKSEHAVNMIGTILDNMYQDKYNKSRKYHHVNSFTEFMNEYIEDLDQDPDFEAADINDRYVNTVSANHLISRGKAEEAEILQILYEHGIDFLGGKKSNEVVRIAREAIGYEKDERHMTKKELKKYKKKMAKREAILRGEIGENAELRHILTGNYLDSSIDDDDDDPMLRFTMSDLQ